MRLLYFIFALFLSYSVLGQSHTNETVRPLIVVDTQFTYNELMILHPSKFISISTINPQKAIGIYGNSARFGVILIETRSDAKIVRIKELLDRFNIAEKYRGLKVRIDNASISDPAKLLADLNEIKNVEIGIEKMDATESQPGIEEVFINIITKASQ